MTADESTTDAPPGGIEENARRDLADARYRLTALRAKRDEINDAIRPLVANLAMLERVVAVFDRAKPDKKARTTSHDEAVS